MGVGRRNVLASYLGVGEFREEKFVILLPRCGWESDGECVSLLPMCGWVSGGEMCYPRTYVCVGVGRRNVLASYIRVGGCREAKCVSLIPRCVWVTGGEMC